jgi:hypothetical protein
MGTVTMMATYYRVYDINHDYVIVKVDDDTKVDAPFLAAKALYPDREFEWVEVRPLLVQGIGR